MRDTDRYDPPKPSAADKGHALVRAGLGTIPYAGAAAAELLNMILAPPLETRRQEWMEEIGKGLRNLENKMGVNLKSLQDNEGFIDIALEATRLAITTSKREKREALKNAVMNEAVGNTPEDSLRSMFMSFVDSLTVWHIKILNLFNAPEAYFKKIGQPVPDLYMGARSHILEKAFPEMTNEREFYDLVWKDLYAKGLVSTDSLHGMMTGQGTLVGCSTKIGKEFMNYISSPIPESDT